MGRIAEMNVLGALLIDASRISDVYFLSSDMFTDAIIGRMFLEYQRGYDNHYDVNVSVLIQNVSCEEYPESSVLEVIRECSEEYQTGTSIKSHANVIKNEYVASKFKRIISSVQVNAGSVYEQIGRIVTDLESLQDGRSSKSKSLSQIAEENKDKYFVDNETEKTYIGFSKLDDFLGGLEGGDMIVIGARPAVGKSAFVTQITSNLSEQGKRIGFYNLEMQEKQVYERFVVSQSGIGMTRLRRAKKFLGDEKERFDKANEVLEKKDNIVITTGSKSVSEIRAESRHMGYDIIIIDYLQLLKSDKEYRGNRYAEVGAISKSIKALAMELNIPIIALSQLNRVSEARDTKEPTMAELREAGDIEQDASVIILMWNLSQEDNSKKGCKVEKQRQGQTGKVVMNFNGDLMRFEETGESVKEAQEWAKSKDDDCPFE